MNQEPETNVNDEMRAEYDFSGGVRGKYFEAYKQSTNIVVLEPTDSELYAPTCKHR
jgi:hypothetical protein